MRVLCESSCKLEDWVEALVNALAKEDPGALAFWAKIYPELDQYLDDEVAWEEIEYQDEIFRDLCESLGEATGGVVGTHPGDAACFGIWFEEVGA